MSSLQGSRSLVFLLSVVLSVDLYTDKKLLLFSTPYQSAGATESIRETEHSIASLVLGVQATSIDVDLVSAHCQVPWLELCRSHRLSPVSRKVEVPSIILRI